MKRERSASQHSVERRRKRTAPGRRADTGSPFIITETDQRMMDRAIELARVAGKAGEVPVGAVIYRGDEVLAEGANNREATNDPAGHAELIAMRLAGERLGTWRLSDCSLAVTLEPCPMCAGAMVNARLGRRVYGAVDPKAGAVTTLYSIATDPRLNHRVAVIGGVQAARCRQLLQAFFKDRRGKSEL
jgi:tRNA(adenine34) deaminase